MGEELKSQEIIEEPSPEKNWELLLKKGGAELAKNEENPRKLIVLIKNPPLAIPPYSDLVDDGKIAMSAEAYFQAVARHITSPEQVHALINPPYLDWIGDSENVANLDPLLDPSEIIKKGGGDCDNLSWVAKCFLDELGKNKCIDYQARVIGGEKHGLTIYKEGGVKKYIDQVDQGTFDKVEELTYLKKFPNKDFLVEVELYNGHKIHRSVDPITLERTNEEMGVDVYENYTESFEPEKELPAGWKDYKVTFMSFNKETTIYYESWFLYQKTSPAGTINYNPDGQIKEMEMPNGDVMIFGNGKLKQKQYAPGSPILFDDYDSDGNIYQRVYKLGEPLKAETFNKNGRIVQKNYWEGSPYRSESLDEAGKVKARWYWDGSYDALDPETGQVLKHFPPQ